MFMHTILLLYLILLPVMPVQALPYQEEETPSIIPEDENQDLRQLPMTALISLFWEEVRQGRVKVPKRILRLLKERGPESEPALPLLIDAVKGQLKFELKGESARNFNSSDRAVNAWRSSSRGGEVSQIEGSIDLGDEAMQVLEAMGVKALLALIKECKFRDEDERAAWKIRTHLMRFTPPDDTLQNYVDLLDHPDERVRVWSAAVISNMEEPGINAVIELVRSEDPEKRLAGVRAALAFTEFEDYFAPQIAPLLDDEDPVLRRAAAFSLGRLTPTSMPVLIKALSDQDVDVRRIAAEALEKSFYPYITGMDSGERGGFSYWHGSWTDSRESRWINCEYILLKKGIPSLAAALRDESVEVRTYAAMALYKLGPIAGKEAIDTLNEVREDSSPVFRYWADLAHQRLSASPWISLRLLAEELGLTERDVPLTEGELDGRVDRLRNATKWELERDEHGVFAWPTGADQEWQAALSLIKRTLLLLLKNEAGSDRKVAEKSRRILNMLDRALSRRIQNLIRIMDDEIGPGFATSNLARLGPVVLPALEHDFLRCPRFPIGPPTYEELLWVLDQNGSKALSILMMGLEHW